MRDGVALALDLEAKPLGVESTSTRSKPRAVYSSKEQGLPFTGPLALHAPEAERHASVRKLRPPLTSITKPDLLI